MTALKFFKISLVTLLLCKCVATDILSDSEVIDAVHAEVTHLASQQDINRLDRETPVSYQGAQLWRVPYTDQAKKNAVSELQKQYNAAMWNLQVANQSSPYVDVFVKRAAVIDARNFMKIARVPFNVLIEDVQRAIDTENPPLDDIASWTNRDGHPMTWTAYHRLADIYNYMDFLAKTYPNLCSVRTIGTSIENRPLRVLRISNGKPSNRAIWIDGGIHAREWISPAAVTYMIDSIVTNWDSEPQEIRAIDWYILPVMNPDGYEFTFRGDRLWRKNRRRHTLCTGVDLNRNYGHKWGGQGSSKQPCSETYAGSRSFSEPETSAVQKFLKESAANFKASLSFHSYGQYILYPWGYDRKVPADHEELDRVGKEAAAAIRAVDGKDYTVGPAGSTLYPASGGSDDFAKGDLKFKYSYTIELRDEGRYGFMLPANQIVLAGEESMAFARVIARAASRA